MKARSSCPSTMRSPRMSRSVGLEQADVEQRALGLQAADDLR